MSYELCFWREQVGTPRTLDPRAVYEALMEERELEGLLPLPIEEFLAAVQQAFPSAGRAPANQLFWEDPDQKSSIEISWSAVHVRVDMRPLQNDHANRLIDIAAHFNAPLYDPQTGERFDGQVA
jgi:hypothetical protein